MMVGSFLFEYYVSALCLMALCALIVSCVCLHGIYKLCIRDSSSWINASNRNLTVITMLAFSLCSVGDFTKETLRFFYFPEKRAIGRMEETSILLNDALYYLGNVMFYVLLLVRLRSLFELNNIVWLALALLIGLAVVGSIGYLVLVALSMHDPTHYLTYFGYLFIALSFNDFVLNTSFFVVFFEKLRRDILGRMEVELMPAAYQREVHLLSNVMTKHCVLFGAALLVNQLFFVYGIYNTLLPHAHTIETDKVNIYAVRAVENAVIVSVLGLALSVNYDRYICLCRGCHACVARCCTKTPDNGMQNPYRELQDL